MAKQNIAVGSGHKLATATDLQLKRPESSRPFGKEFALYIRVLRQNWRQGTVGCKTRSEVAFSNRKPWKQKGTGRARAGSARSPLWRKGGVLFGPQPRTRTLQLPRKVRAQVMNSLLWDRLARKKIVELDYTHVGDAPKTAAIFTVLKSAGLAHQRVTLFVASADYQLHASCANIANVDLYLFDQPNAYALSRGEYWVYFKKDSEAFKQMVDTWS